jgi:hypothetical protein
MIAINQRNPTICTKNNPKRIDTTVFVWTKPTCTSDCIIRAAKIATDTTFTVALATSHVQGKDDRAKHRKILDTVCMCAHRALIPIFSLNLISSELTDRDTPLKNPTPPVYAHRSEQ